jgi:hypothetical protein
MNDVYKCPECGGEAVDADCLECEGSGEVLCGEDEFEDCMACGGAGTTFDDFECLECGHVYSEADVVGGD